MTADVLEAIVAAARHAAAVREAATPAGALDQAAVRRPDGKGFARALRETEFPRIIAECKRRSPSRGILRRDYDPGRTPGSSRAGRQRPAPLLSCSRIRHPGENRWTTCSNSTA